jgi:endonuclease IV
LIIVEKSVILINIIYNIITGEFIMLYIGCHLSASKGYEDMGKQALSINANTFAFFTRNPRGGSAKAISVEDTEKFLKLANG